MKSIFAILSLVVVLGVVSLLARKQMQAVGIGGTGHPAVTASQTTPSVAGADGRTVAEQARTIEQKARDDVTEALKKGADRNERADP